MSQTTAQGFLKAPFIYDACEQMLQLMTIVPSLCYFASMISFGLHSTLVISRKEKNMPTLEESKKRGTVKTEPKVTIWVQNPGQ